MLQDWINLMNSFLFLNLPLLAFEMGTYVYNMK